MRGVLVMTMATISTSGRDVFPAGSSSHIYRLVLLKFRLVAAANPRKSSRLIFFLDETLHIAKEGDKWANRVPTSPDVAARGEAAATRFVGPWQLPLALLSPRIFYIFLKNSTLIFTAFGVA